MPFIQGWYERLLEEDAQQPKSTGTSERPQDQLKSQLETLLSSMQETTPSSSSGSRARAMLDHVASLVTGDRDRTHGSKAENFGNIAVIWDAYMAQRIRMYHLHGEEGQLIRPQDVCALMILLKVARTLHGAHNPDDWMDTAGYAACAYELTGDIK